MPIVVRLVVEGPTWAAITAALREAVRQLPSAPPRARVTLAHGATLEPVAPDPPLTDVDKWW